MVQRYDLKEDCVTGHIDLEKDADGDWVRYGDYKELDGSFQDYIATTDMEIEGLVSRLAEVNAELQKYKDQFPDYVECANCGSVTHAEGVEDVMGQSGCRKEDAQECKHEWVMHDVDDFQTCSKCGRMA